MADTTTKEPDIWVTIRMRGFGFSNKVIASRTAQEIIGSMYQPYGAKRGWDKAELWITDVPPDVVEAQDD